MARRALNASHQLYFGGVLVATLNPPRDTAYPRLELDQQKGVLGWHSGADADEVVTYLPAGRRGEEFAPRTPRGKTLTYNLVAKAMNEADLNDDAMDYYRGIFADKSSLGFLIAVPWPGGDLPGDQWATFVRILDFDCDELNQHPQNAVPSPYQREMTLSFRQPDSRWLWWNETGTPSEMKSYENLAGNAVVVTNAGNSHIEPIITVFGVDDGDDVHIGRDLPGGGSVNLWFRDPGAGDLIVDFPTRSARLDTGTDIVDVSDTYDASSSQWWDEFTEGIPGQKPTNPVDHNVFKGPGAGTGIRVEFFSASE